ncbi:aldehyde dehydrogenase [Rhodococcus sp. 06-235-1A]|uniref:aldehyde dehydrogenase n=1 Tax=Rhodococcus sp. 06-235-1A TaxID=2022508 RepID=UPI000B9A6310|nr:aldehyde dehydrogenase [Rhodococcus sp. 06-235-1A]OZD06583.1 aldehyde dehydrogenase [Rhodococcus sp. 06-235-1A]
MLITYDRLSIGGEWVAPSTEARIKVTNASTGAQIGSVPEASEPDIDAAVSAARMAFDNNSGWSTWAPTQRALALRSLADQLEQRAENMAHRVSSQNGMPISISRHLEGMHPVSVLRYYADLAERMPVEEDRDGINGPVVVRRQPVGVVAAIAPWNFPQTLAAFKYAPALAAGCTLVIKPSPETVLDSALFAEAVHASDIPAGVVNVVPGGREAGAYLVGHRDVDKVAFTGSTAAGRSIGEVCGRLLRPVTLELGGKSAAIVLDDADLNLERIGQELFAATLFNNGQTCFLGTRILAPRSRYAEVVDAIATLASSLRVGDALDPETQIGPMVSRSHRDRVERYIAKGKEEGARLVVGGGRPRGDGPGWFVEPTVFADVDNRSTIAQEEIFGPVLSIVSYTDDDDAIWIANDSDYGLGGSVWTNDPKRGRAVANRVQTGTIGINHYRPDLAAPFGGFKNSGVGRELGPEGLAAYQQLQTIFC